MKKKIVNAFLMVALIVSSVGTFVSCKDYDEDAYVDLRNRIGSEASLRETLKKQVENLDAALAQLKATVENDYLTKVEAANTYVTIATYNEYITNNDVKIQLLQEAISKLETAIAEIKNDMATKDDLAAITLKINEANQTASEALGKANEALSLSQQNAEEIAKIWEIIGKPDDPNPGTDPTPFNDSTLWAAIHSLQDAIQGWGDEITNVNLRVDSLAAAMESYELRISLLEQNFDSLSKVVELNSQQILEIQSQITKMQEEWNTKINVILEKAIAASDEAKQIAQEALKKASEALLAAEAANAKASNAEQLALNAFYAAQEACEIAKKLQSDLESAIKRAEDAAARAEAAADKAEAAQKKVEELYDKLKDLDPAAIQQAIDDAKAAKEIAETAKKIADAAKEAADKAQATADEAKATADQAAKDIEDLKKKDADLEARVKAMEDAVITGCSCGDLKGEVEKAVKDLNDKIDDINDDIKDINKAIEDLQKNFDSQITSIVVQATANPVLGYVNLPLDARSTLLMAYFGIADNAFAFPAAGGEWVNDDERFTDADIAIMTGGSSLNSVAGYTTQAGGVCFSKDGDTSGKVDMGTVYVTVNPSSVDFSGKTFTLENSRGEQSIVSLSPAKKSNYLITAGYDRTRADNGFYEADAYMDLTDTNLKSISLSLDIDGLKSKAKAAYKSKSKGSIISLLADVYNSIDNKIELNALKATWNDVDGNAHDVYSNYTIGTTTIKPLSFNTLNLDILKKLPGKKLIYKVIDKIISQIKINVPNIDLDKGITFNKVDAYDNKIVVTFTCQVNGFTQTGSITLTTTAEDITTVEQIKNLIFSADDGDITVALGEFLTEINNLDTEWIAAIEKAKDDMIAGMQNYVDKAYTKANSIIHLYTLFDINLVAYQPGKGFVFTGSTVDRATKLTSGAMLIPTSNTAEYFAPAYKKYVAISNVYNASTKAALSQSEATTKAQAASGINMNTVISGDTYVQINGEAGYIYEISYAAVDYHGLKTRQTFYVQF